jgi:MFS family permease
MVAALALPRALERLPDRPVMLAGLAVLVLGLALGSIVQGMNGLLPLWFVLGLGYSAAQTPSGRLRARSAHPEDRPSVYAAQFALSMCLLAGVLSIGRVAWGKSGASWAFAVLCGSDRRACTDPQAMAGR